VLLSSESHPDYTFRMGDRSSVSVAGLPATLDPYSSNTGTLTLKFQGGACDGQVLTATLSQ
jgi:hypothetical protein